MLSYVGWNVGAHLRSSGARQFLGIIGTGEPSLPHAMQPSVSAKPNARSPPRPAYTSEHPCGKRLTAQRYEGCSRHSSAAAPSVVRNARVEDDLLAARVLHQL